MKSHNAARKAARWGRMPRVLLAAWLTALAITIWESTALAGPVTTGLTVWLDAADPTGTGSAPVPGALSTWVNKAPSGQQDGVGSVTQGTSLDQPTVTTAALGLNGLSVVRFNGTSDFMQSVAFTSALSSPTEVFMVWKADSIGTGASIAFDGLTGTGRQTISYEFQGGGNVIDMGAGTPAGANSGIATSFASPIYSTAIFNYDGHGDGSLRIDGMNQTFSTPYVGFNPLDGVTVGGRFAPYMGTEYSLDGYIAEMLVYSGTETYLESIQGQVETYLYDKWFVPVPEPGSATLAMIGLISLAAFTSRWRRPLA